MYNREDFKNWLFIDTETVSATQNIDEYVKILGDNAHDHWANKTKYIRQNDSTLVETHDKEIYQSHAALYPEFGKVIVITVGQVKFEDETPVAKIRSIYGDDEAKVLQEFTQMMAKIFQTNGNVKLVGHNIKGFDLPYILKKCIVNGVPIPYKLQLQKMKPWENCLLDTSEIWKFGTYSGGASLSLICDLLQIPSPKENMYGGEVTEAYWNDNRLEDIKDYCESDVKATMNLMLKMSNMPIIE
jgi:predicted PolB exonuclease-like 3'-5' exonuclease